MIYYSSRTLNDAQVNYTTTEKEFFGSSVRIGEIPPIPTWDQNHDIHRPFCTSIPNAQKEYEGPTHLLDPPPSRI